jgi:hypothetical protein
MGYSILAIAFAFIAGDGCKACNFVSNNERFYRMKKLFLFFSLSALMACQSNQPEEPVQSQDEAGQSDPEEWCYAMRDGEKMRFLKLGIHGDEVLGTLQNHLPGTSWKSGSVSGSMEGDTLFLRFMYSENGKDTIRQIAFLRQGERLLDGTGPLTENAFGDLVFDRDKLSFSSNDELTRVDCRNNEELTASFRICWSSLYSDYIDLDRQAVSLADVKGTGKPAYVIRMEGYPQAEIWLPGQTGSLILALKSDENSQKVWTSSSYTLIQDQGFQLQKSGETLFSAQ